MTALRIIFMGAADLSCASFEALARDTKFQIAAIVTHLKRAGFKILPITADVPTSKRFELIQQ